MVYEWTDASRLKLIKRFEKKRILWDSKNAGYKDKKGTHDAWELIAKKFGLTKEEVENEMMLFLKKYEKEKDVVKDSKKNDEIYQSQWHFYHYFDKDGFLGGIKDDSVYQTIQELKAKEVMYKKSVQTSKNAEPPVSPMIYSRTPDTVRKPSMVFPTIEVLQHEVIPPVVQDNCHYFCKRLESRLRDLKPESQKKAMRQIDMMMYFAEGL
ncbi:uncharacterized protein LOC113367711 [Ctenocephalides felis]|uniref:uncharacterized protein LOC113367711 n=1 Tax=Ctenocephalides felis TaxID=7515 RepID=UPI000E6E22A5|nr:uncharacterized protein LOC113367711 [Ctenocephalides felis]